MLKQQVVRDGMTHLSNHQHFLELLSQEVSRAERYKHPLSLLMADIDLFKAINDNFGMYNRLKDMSQNLAAFRQDLIDGGVLRRGRIWHDPWPLRAAELTHLDDRLVRAAGVDVDGAPVVSIPIAICLFFMMYPIMVKIDFGEVLRAGRSIKPVGLTLFVDRINA